MLAAASRAASSGRHRIAISQALIAAARLSGFFALRGGQRHELQVGPAVQSLVDLQAGRALVTVDENNR